MANIISLRRMGRIRRYYASIAPWAAGYFEADDSVTGDHGVRYSRWSFLFTMGSMVILVNSVLGGATVTLACALAAKAAVPVATAVGIVAGLMFLAFGLRYEHRRLTPVVIASAAAAVPGTATHGRPS